MSDQEKFNEEEYHFADDPDMSSFTEKSEFTDPASDKPANTKNAGIMGNVSGYTEKLRTQLPGGLKSFIDLLKQNFILRMVILIVFILIISVVIYRCSSDPLAEKIIEKPRVIAAARPKVTTGISHTATPVMTVSTHALMPVEHHISQEKLSELEKNASHLQTQITALSNQLTGMNGNITSMMNNLKVVNDQLSQLAASLQNQVQATAALAEKIKQPRSIPNPNKPVGPIAIANPPILYSLQAVIPGRAWLIGSNGETLTVREGSKVINYGIVRYIDAKRGRVLTSSGQVIKFSQDDS